jgi:NADH:ubiquinone oxidoreductase subunit 3 (subunit A)
MSPWAFLNGSGGVWTFVIAVCFVLFLLFGFNWVH